MESAAHFRAPFRRSKPSQRTVMSIELPADTILAHVPAISYPFATDDWNALRDASVAYRNTLEQNLQQIQTGLLKIHSDSAGVQQRLAELEAEIGTERANLTSLASEFQSQFS